MKAGFGADLSGSKSRFHLIQAEDLKHVISSLWASISSLQGKQGHLLLKYTLITLVLWKQRQVDAYLEPVGWTA